MGTILPYVGELDKIPKKWHLCDGTDGTPDLTGRFLQGWGSDGYTVYNSGNYLSPGLPNITGNFATNDKKYSSWFSGVFKFLYEKHGGYYDSDGGSEGGIGDFDASRCSVIYGASKTVQPRSYVVYFIIKVK